MFTNSEHIVLGRFPSYLRIKQKSLCQFMFLLTKSFFNSQYLDKVFDCQKSQFCEHRISKLGFLTASLIPLKSQTFNTRVEQIC